MRPTEGEFCWARTHDTCAAGSGVSHPRRSPSLRLPAFRLRRRPGGPSSGGIFSSATSLFGGSKKIAVAPIIGTTPEVAQQLSDALVAAGKRSRADDRPRGRQGELHLARLSHRHQRGQGLEDLLYLGRQRRQGGRAWRGSRAKRSSPDGRAAILGANVDSAAIRSIAGKTTSQLAASMPRGGGSASAVAAASDAAPHRDGVNPAAGAAGRGA